MCAPLVSSPWHSLCTIIILFDISKKMAHTLTTTDVKDERFRLFIYLFFLTFALHIGQQRTRVAKSLSFLYSLPGRVLLCFGVAFSFFFLGRPISTTINVRATILPKNAPRTGPGCSCSCGVEQLPLSENGIQKIHSRPYILCMRVPLYLFVECPDTGSDESSN